MLSTKCSPVTDVKHSLILVSNIDRNDAFTRFVNGTCTSAKGCKDITTVPLFSPLYVAGIEEPSNSVGIAYCGIIKALPQMSVKSQQKWCSHNGPRACGFRFSNVFCMIRIEMYVSNSRQSLLFTSSTNESGPGSFWSTWPHYTDVCGAIETASVSGGRFFIMVIDVDSNRMLRYHITLKSKEMDCSLPFEKCLRDKLWFSKRAQYHREANI